MEQRFIIFCDLDGVIVDFRRGYEELTGVDLGKTFHNDDKFWEPINKAGYNFWINLKWMPDGKKMWDYIKKYDPIILSAPSRQDESKVGKFDWVKREIPGAHLILRTAKNKKEFATPNSILIDDLPDNVKAWKDAGGIAIHHTSTDDTIKQLKYLKL